jgi:hypothetical protein
MDMADKSPKADFAQQEKDRLRVYQVIDRSCDLAFRIGPHPLDPDCQCLACMTKRKKKLYPISGNWKFTL